MCVTCPRPVFYPKTPPQPEQSSDLNVGLISFYPRPFPKENSLPSLKRGLLYLLLLGASPLARACDQLPPGQPLWIRLTSPISTYTAHPGDPVHAVLIHDLYCDDQLLVPMGSSIDGVVRSTRKVGWGIRHETAALQLVFTRATPASGSSIDLSARVEEVENARESVHNGVIQGIRSTNTFQGRINSSMIHLPTWNPYSDPIVLTYKIVFPIFPEPEIFYPTGTGLRLRTTSDITLPATVTPAILELPPPSSQFTGSSRSFQIPGPTEPQSADEPEQPEQSEQSEDSPEIDRLVAQLPTRVTTGKGVNADLINIVFLGSRETVDQAFRESGWQNADPVSGRTVLRGFYALLNNSGYAREPMTTFYLNGHRQDINWQNSLNSYDRRDHIRVWQWQDSTPASPIWIGASTHDTSAVLTVRHPRFVHHIAPAIDDERSTIIRDLDFAGCLQSVRYIDRPAVPGHTRNAIGDPMVTDGAIAVVALRPCTLAAPGPAPAAVVGRYRPGNHVFRFIRRSILTAKNDLLRENIVYSVYDVGRMGFAALRSHPLPIEPESAPTPISHPTQGFHTYVATGQQPSSPLQLY